MSFFPEELAAYLSGRRETDGPRSGGYTEKLLAGGLPLLSRKLVEESGEVVAAAISEDREGVINEIADLWYHSLVFLMHQGIDPGEVQDCLKARHEKARG